MKEFEINSYVRGYHVYSSIWEISIGEQFECARETLNDSDRYAVAVIKDSVIIGHCECAHYFYVEVEV